MINEETVRGLAKRLADVIPQNMRTASEDVERNIRGVLDAGLAKMNLVSREEFDVQAAVLQRTRNKLEQLEATIAELETAFEDE
ncbi:MAG: accessory factor UbiK family protein [Pseudomonadota bacterium]